MTHTDKTCSSRFCVVCVLTSIKKKAKRTASTLVHSLRTVAVRKQNIVYATLILLGTTFSAYGSSAGNLYNDPVRVILVSEGIAFIIIGCVGMIMSLTSMDIGDSIKEEVATASEKNLEASERTIDAVKEASEKNIEAINSLEKTLTGPLLDIKESLLDIKDILLNMHSDKFQR